MPADSLPDNALLTQRMFQGLLTSQYASSDDLASHQEQTLQALLAHAAKTVPFYRTHLSGLSDPKGHVGQDEFQSIEPIGRSMVERHWPKFMSQDVPVNHGQQRIVMTAGTAGAPLRVMRTAMTDIADAAAAFRHYDNFQLDCSRDMAEIMAPSGYTRRREGLHVDRDHWGHPWTADTERGRLHRFSVFSSAADQWAWLTSFKKPFYLRTYPSNLYRLLEQGSGTEFAGENVLAVLTTGEPVPPDLRETCRQQFGCEIIDHYATAECGLVATQCPESDRFHVQQENCLVEVLRDDGRRCDIGEEGRLTVTPLYNHAFPLIRYQPGDRARFAATCSCGRTLPCLEADIHRPEHAIDCGSERIWYLPGHIRTELNALAPGVSWKLVQSDADRISFIYARPQAVDRLNETGITHVLKSEFGDSAAITCVERSAVGRNPGGMFACLERQPGRARP